MQTISTKIIALLFCASLFSIQSCSLLDVDRVEVAPWEPIVAIPLINSDLDIYDLTDSLDVSFINTQSDGLIEFVYQDSIESFRLADLVDIPAFSISEGLSFPLPSLEDVSISADFGVADLLADAPLNSGSPIPPFRNVNFTGQLPEIPVFESAIVESGSISVNIRNTFPARLNFTLVLLDVNSNTAIGEARFNIASGGSQRREIDLAGKSIGKKLEFRMDNISSPGSSEAYNPNVELAFDIDLSNLAMREITFINTTELSYSQLVMLPLDMPNEIELYNIALANGKISYAVEASTGIDFITTAVLPSSTADGQILSSTLEVSNGSGAASISLLNSRIDFTTGDQKFNELPIEATITIPVTNNPITLRSNNNIGFEATIEDIDFEEVNAYLGNQQLDLRGDSVAIGVFENTLDGIRSEVELVDPKLEFSVSNEYGIPFDFNFVNTFATRNDGQVYPIDLSPNPISMEAGSIANPATGTISVTNLNALFNARPEIIYYDASVIVNPNGKSVNFINKEQRITVNVEAQVPMHGTIELLSISDPTNVDLSSGQSLDELQSMELQVVFENGFPIDVRPQFYLYDEAGVLIDSVFEGGDNNLFMAASVNDEGLVTSPNVSERRISLPEDKLDRLFNTRKIALRLELKTAEDGQKNVKMLDSYRIKGRMGALATLRIDP